MRTLMVRSCCYFQPWGFPDMGRTPGNGCSDPLACALIMEEMAIQQDGVEAQAQGLIMRRSSIHVLV